MSSAAPAINDQVYSLRRIFGADAPFVSVIAGANSIQNAPTDPLLGIDAIYNTGQAFPAAGYTVNTQANQGATSSGTTASIRTTAANNLTVGATVTVSGVPVAGYNGTFTVTATGANNSFSYTTPDADLAPSGGGSVGTQTRARINAYFARGGAYIAGNGGNNLSFLTGAVPPLVGGSFTQASLSSFGGTAAWTNVGGSGSPLTGSFPSLDYLYLPSNVTYFSAIPTGAVIDGQYLSEMGSAAKPRGPTAGYVAGLWLNRDTAAALASNNAPMVIHGNTSAGSRYTGLGTNPFSRSDFERIWGWIVQSALWGDLTDEALLDQTITADTLTDKVWGNADFPITATSTSGRSVSLAAAGDCTLDSPYSPAMIHITAAGSCTITASHPGDGNYNPAVDVVQTITIAQAAASATYTGDPMASLAGSATSAMILLQATAIDTALAEGAPDSGLGDIRTATVTFKEGATTLCGPLAVGLIGDSLDTGAANCSVSLGIGSHTIDIVVDGNYTGTESDHGRRGDRRQGPGERGHGRGRVRLLELELGGDLQGRCRIDREVPGRRQARYECCQGQRRPDLQGRSEDIPHRDDFAEHPRQGTSGRRNQLRQGTEHDLRWSRIPPRHGRPARSHHEEADCHRNRVHHPGGSDRPRQGCQRLDRVHLVGRHHAALLERVGRSRHPGAVVDQGQYRRQLSTPRIHDPRHGGASDDRPAPRSIFTGE